MQLFLVRHAIAQDRRPGLSEAERALTEEGRRRFRLEVEGLRRLDVRLGRVLTSPLVRARQTAELLAPLADGGVEVCEALAAPPSPALLRALRGEAVTAVGHEPWMSELCAWLVAGQRDLGLSFAFKKGGVACLEGEPTSAGMRLVAFLPPRMLRQLGGEPARGDG